MKRIVTILILGVFLISCTKEISEFQSDNFIKYYWNGWESRGNDVLELEDGSYLLTGYDQPQDNNKDVFLIKADKNGNALWSKTYGSADNQEEGKVVKTVSDGYIIAGISETDTITHSFVLKLNTEGDSLWYKEFGDADINIIVNDIAINQDAIYIAGYSQKENLKSSYYYTKLNLLGERVWPKYQRGVQNSNSALNNVFLENDLPVFVGYDGSERKISILPLGENGDGPAYPVSEAGETVADAVFMNSQLYILAKNDHVTSTALLKVYNVNTDAELVWETESIGSIDAKSLTFWSDNHLIVLAETLQEPTLINTIEVDENGMLTYGEEAFGSIAGSAEQVIQTRDNGILFIGATNATYGLRMQLIKTDKDLFLMRP